MLYVRITICIQIFHKDKHKFSIFQTDTRDSNTKLAGPVIKRWLSFLSIINVPPGRSTFTGQVTLPDAVMAKADAHAPVPQARVSPTPRSHVRWRRMLGASADTNSIFAL